MIKNNDMLEILHLRIDEKYSYSKLIKEYNGRYNYEDFKHLFDSAKKIVNKKEKINKEKYNKKEECIEK